MFVYLVSLVLLLFFTQASYAPTADSDEVSMLPDSLEDMAEYAISKVMAAGAGVAKNVMNFLKDMDEVGLRIVFSSLLLSSTSQHPTTGTQLVLLFIVHLSKTIRNRFGNHLHMFSLFQNQYSRVQISNFSNSSMIA